MINKNINIYPEKNNDVTIRWVVEYVDSEGNGKKLFKESEDKAIQAKNDLETQDKEITELVGDEGGLIQGNLPQSAGAVGSTQITSKSTTDDFVNATRQDLPRSMMYRKFYGESIEDETPAHKPRARVSPISGIDSLFLSSEINEVDKTAEALGDIYAQSTDPIDFERKAKMIGYDNNEIESRQEKFFRKTSQDQKQTNNPKIPLEEMDIVEDVLTNQSQRNDIVMRSKNQETGNDYSVPYYDQLKEKNPMIARKLIYLIDIIKRDDVDQKNKAAIIWQFLNGVGVNDLNPGDKNYIIQYLQNGK